MNNTTIKEKDYFIVLYLIKKIQLFPIIVLCFLCSWSCYSQNTDTTDEVFDKYKRLDTITHNYFKEHKLDAFTEKDIEYLLNIYFDQLEMLPKLKEKTTTRYYFHKLRGYYFKKIKLYKYSNTHYLRSIQLFDSVPKLFPDIKQQMYYGLKEVADNYQIINKKDSATYYYRKVIEFTNTHIKHDIGLSSALNDLGIHYSENMHELDSAMVNFQKAMDIVDKEPRKSFLILKGSINDNIANVYLAKKQFNKAKSLFEENFTLYHPDNYENPVDYERWARAGIQIVETSLKLGEIDALNGLLNDIDSIITNNDFTKKPETKIRYLKAVEELYTAKGALDSAAIILKNRKQLQGKLQRKKQERYTLWNTHLKALALNRLNTKFKAKQELEQIKMREERAKFWIIILLLILCTCILILIIVLNKQRLKNIKQNELLAEKELGIMTLENQLLNEKFELNKKDLADFALNLSQNQKWVQSLAKHINSLKTSTGRNKTKKFKELEEFINQKISFDENTKSFFEKANQINNEFYSKLHQQFPNLSKADIKLCSMIRLGFDIYQIAQLQNINFSSVYQSRYRLKKKMNLNDDQSLEFTLKNL